MKKNIITFCILGLTFLSANANANNLVSKTPCHFNGFYLGVGGGGSQANYSTVSNFTDTDDIVGVTFISQTFRNTPTITNGLGTAFAGLGGAWNQKWYLGAEVAGTWSSINTNMYDNGPTVFTDFDGISDNLYLHPNTWEFDADARPGVLLTPSTLLYLRAGVAIRNMKFDYSAAAIGVFEATHTEFSGQTAYNASSTQQGLRLGVGVEQMVLNNIALGVDYVHTEYGNINAAATTPIVDPNGRRLFPATSVSYRTNAVSFRLSYYIDANRFI